MSLPVSYPGIIFYNLFVGNTFHEQLKQAAHVVAGLMEFKAKLDGKRLTVENRPNEENMDMSQYGKFPLITSEGLQLQQRD